MLTIGIISHRNRDVDVAGKPGYGPGGDCESSDHRPATTMSLKINRDTSQCGFKRIQSNLRDGRPAASPPGAPGLSSRHSSSIWAICCSLASG
jgi:hypothetical protein